MQNINVHCILGYRRKMSEIIQLIRYENNGRLGSDCLSGQNDRWNSNLSKNRPTCVFIGSFLISDIAIFGCVIEKHYDSLSDLIISFGTAKNQIIFIDVSIGTQNILFLPVPAYTQNMVAYKYRQFVGGMVGEHTAFYPSTGIYRGSDLWTPRTMFQRVSTVYKVNFRILPVHNLEA